METNHYEILGLSENASNIEIKKAYRLLAKKYHPDTGGEKDKFLAIQQSWEILNDPLKKENYDRNLYLSRKSSVDLNVNWSLELKAKKNTSTIKDANIQDWINTVYNPANRLISLIIKPLNYQIKALSADPYDNKLMDDFCDYINSCQKKIEKVESIYKSKIVPNSISIIGLDLYHCYSQVKDALSDLDRYTKGYVDDYLFDGKEIMKEAKRIQAKMKINKKNIIF